jgi:hypothetical protein
MSKERIVEYNVKNVKYAVKDALGEYGAPIDLAYASQISLEPDYSEEVVYGDGQKLFVIPNDKGLSGKLIVLNRDKDYEIACGRQLEISEGLAEVEQHDAIEHAIYFEVERNQNGVKTTKKVWLLEVTTGRPSESFEQVTDNPNMSPVEYSLTVFGKNLRNNLDTADYTDANGNTKRVTRISVIPTDTNYATFGDTVPTPTSAT